MAITENLFTADELKAAIKETPELVTIVTEVLTKEQKLKVLKDDEFQAEVQKVEKAAIDRTTADIYGNIDKDLDSLGFKKENPEEKTYERVKKIIANQTASVKDLTEKLKANSGDEVLKQQLKAAQEAEASAKDRLQSLEKEHKIEKVRSYVESGFSGKALRKDLPEIMLKSTIDAQKQALIQSAEFTSEGKIYFKDDSGKAILKAGSSDFASAADIFSDRLKELFDNGGDPGSGGGSKPPIGTSTGVKNPEGKEIVIPTDLKTKVELHTYLQKQGLTATSKEFIELYDKHGKDLKLR
jgi:hypothetical protein